MSNTNIEPRQENVDIMAEDIISTFNGDAYVCLCHVAAIKEEILSFLSFSNNPEYKNRYQFWDEVHQILSRKLLTL